jgi:uncharacterized membrane protein YfcA
MVYLLLIVATLATSIISGVLSMAGGVILMGIFGLLLTVPAAMTLHGVAQTVSNGSRIWLHRRHIKWSVLLPYSIGSAIVLGFFTAVSLVPEKSLVFILIGLFPFIAFALPTQLNLDIERPAVAVVCGLVVTSIQMLAGASGPVLDVFYLKSEMTRHQILATKAVTQTLGHVIKLFYYVWIIGLVANLPMWVYLLVIIGAIAGNWIAKFIVDRIRDEHFRLGGRYLVLSIGAVFLVHGIWLSLTA